jgi:hypothetical protein
MIYLVKSPRFGVVGEQWHPSSHRELLYALGAGLVEPVEESTNKPKKSSTIKKAPKE